MDRKDINSEPDVFRQLINGRKQELLAFPEEKEIKPVTTDDINNSELLKKYATGKNFSSISRTRSSKTIRIIMIAAFFLCLCFFVFAEIIVPDKSFSEKEKRSLAAFPPINISSVLSGYFMSSFESYLSDHFILRNAMLSLKSYTSRVFGKSEINGVYTGKNNRLYEVPTEYDERRVSETIDAIAGFSNSCGIVNQYFMLVPNSSEIIQKDLPPFLSLPSQRAQIEKIYSLLPSNVVGLEAYEALNAAADKDGLYLKTDHHWSAYGAFCAFRNFADVLEIKYSDSDFKYINLSDAYFGTLASASGIYEQPDLIEACVPVDSAGNYYVFNAETKTKSPSVFDLSKLEGNEQYEVFLGGNFPKIEIFTKNMGVNNLLIFKDSYANCFIPLLTPYFHKIVVIDPRYYTEDIASCIADNEFSHLLYLYNVNTFLEDTVLKDALD